MIRTAVQTPQGGEPQSDTFTARRRARRCVVRNGNSYTVALPKEFRSRLNILPLQQLELILYEDQGGFFVKPVPIGSEIPFKGRL